MGGEGSMMMANQSLKANRRMLSRKNRKSVSLVSESSEKFIDPVQATPEQIQRIRERLQAERRSKNRIILVLTALFFIITGGCLVYFLS